jgi:hypothetical protein
MKWVHIFTLLFFCTAKAVACDCLEHNHTIMELDDYAIINAKTAVILQAEEAVVVGKYVVIKATVLRQIKKTEVRQIYIRGAVIDTNFGFDLKGMANRKLLLLDANVRIDTIDVNHCSQLWLWYDDLNVVKSDPAYFKIAQRHYVITMYITTNGQFDKAFAKYTTGHNSGIGKYTNGLAQGRWIHYTIDKELFAKGEYQNGMKIGPWIESYFTMDRSKSGRKIRLIKIGYQKGIYVNGKRDGKWILFNKERGTQTFFYKNGQILPQHGQLD